MTSPNEPPRKDATPRQVMPTPPTLVGPILDYGSTPPRDRTTFVVGATKGFLAWVAIEVVMFAIFRFFEPGGALLPVGGFFVVTAAAFVISLTRRGIPGFVAGLLLGLLFTCILPLSAIVLTCGNVL